MGEKLHGRSGIKTYEGVKGNDVEDEGDEDWEEKGGRTGRREEMTK